MNKSQHPYFEFLVAKYSQPTVKGLDPVSEKLLECIALENYKGNHITMMQALRFSTSLLLSEKTVANRIKQLQTLDLIEVHVDEADRRVKFLYPSRKASDYFKLLSTQIARGNAIS